MTTRRRRTDYDIAVVGGGLAGATAAVLLQQSGFRVLLADSVRPEPLAPSAPFDLRVSTFSPGSQRVLLAAGAWNELAPERLASFDRMTVWEVDGGEISFDATNSLESALGTVAENRAVQVALWNAAERAGVQLRSPAVATEFEPAGADTWRLRFDDNETCLVNLILAADGPQSPIRSLAGIDVDEHDYDQRGVVAVLDIEGGHEDTAWQRFTTDGPIALLPLPNNQCSLVWSTRQADERLAWSEKRFSDELSAMMEGRVGRLSLASDRASFPLRYQQAHRYVAPGIALLGDAAHVVHPLAGQGANLGLADAAAIAQVLGRADEQPIGSLAVLRRYERWRRSENVVAANFLDGLHRLFSSSDSTARTLRGSGLSLVSRLMPVKSLFASLASGTGPGAPDLCRERAS